MDVLEFVGDPNCPHCLEKMALVVVGFWCNHCQIASGPGRDKTAPTRPEG